MIACCDAEGRIYNVYHDPVPEGMQAHLTKIGVQWVETSAPLSVVALSRQMYVTGGVLTLRPACPAQLVVDGPAITLTGIPAGAAVTLVLDPGDSFESRLPLSPVGGAVSFELDEPGPATILVSPPWPYREGSYVLDHQQG